MKRGVFLTGLALIISACASEPQAPEPLPPTIVNLQIEAAANANTGGDGAAAPIVLRLYELKERSAFNAVDFFGLFNDDKSALGTDMVRKQEWFLKPGERKTVNLQPDNATRVLGFLAAFRQLDTARWRGVVDVVPNQTKTYAVKVAGNQLTVDPVP